MKTVSVHLRLPLPTISRVDKLRREYTEFGPISRAQVLRSLIADGLQKAEEDRHAPVIPSAKDEQGGA